jgi:hydroxypyruvate isomerase
MPRFAASLMFLFAEVPFAERFARAREAGFQAVECQNPYPWPAADIRRWLDQAGLAMVLINAPSGDADQGERGFAALPGREDDFRASVERGLDYARTLACPRLHVLAGNAPQGADRAALECAYVANLRWAAERAAREGVKVLIEPLNETDMPGYFLNRMDQARALADAAGHANVWLQFDVYHAAMSGQDLAETFRRHRTRIDHIQIAGVPGRHEPEPSAIPYGELFALFDSSGYAGWIGCEYRPRALVWAHHLTRAGTREGLVWAAKYGLGSRPWSG